MRNGAVRKKKVWPLSRTGTTALVAAGALATAVTVGGIKANNSLQARRVETQKAFAAQFQAHVPRGVALEHTNSWVTISRVYGLSPTNSVHLKWMTKVNALARKTGLPPESVIRTMAREQMDSSTATALNASIRRFEQANVEHARRIGEGQQTRSRTRAMRINSAEIQRLKNIQQIINEVERDPALSSLSSYVSKAGKASALETAFGLR